MRPSWPISAIASRGKRASRSHSAAKGWRRSRAKLRAISRTISCSWLSLIQTLLPGQLLALVAEEPAAVGRLQPGDDAAHPGDTVLGAHLGAAPAHLGADPAGMEQHRRH